MKHRQTDPGALPLIRFRRTGQILLAILMTVTVFFFLLALVLPDKTVSEQENRKLASRPAFSASELFAGEYIPKVETYWSDTFPLRNFFLTVNSGISKITSRMSFRSKDVVVVQNNKPEDFGGQSLHEVTGAEQPKEEA